MTTQNPLSRKSGFSDFDFLLLHPWSRNNIHPHSQYSLRLLGRQASHTCSTLEKCQLDLFWIKPAKRCIPTTRGKLVPRTKGLFQSKSLETWTDQAWPCGTESSPLQTKGDAGKALEQAQHGVKEEHRVGIKMLKVYAVSFLFSFRGIQSCYQLCRKTYLVWWRKYLLKDVKAHKHSKKEHLTFTSPIPWTNNLLRWDSQGETYSVVLFQVISFLSKPNK